MHDAVAAGDLARVEILIKTQCDLNQRDAEGRTPLHRAIELEHDNVALELVGSRADAALRIFSSSTPPVGDVGMSALHWAAAQGRNAVLRALLSRSDVDINSLGSGEICPGPLCAALGGVLNGGTDAERLVVMRAALEKGAVTNDWMKRDDLQGMQPLHAAVYSGFYEAAELLITAGALVNLSAAPGTNMPIPPICMAPHAGRFDTFQLLLDSGADIHALDFEDNNFWHYCVGNGFDTMPTAAVPAASRMMRVALEAGVNVGQGGRGYYDAELENVTPLQAACKIGATWAIPLLLEEEMM